MKRTNAKKQTEQNAPKALHGFRRWLAIKRGEHIATYGHYNDERARDILAAAFNTCTFTKI